MFTEHLPVQEIQREVTGSERLLWSGMPRQGIFFSGADLFLIPFSLMWGGFAFFWEYQAVTQGAPFFFLIWGIPFVLVGIYFIVGRFFVDARQRRATYYGLTDQRVIIISGIFTRKVKSLNLWTLSDISLTEKSDRSGTIILGPSNPWASMYMGMSWPGVPRTDTFVGVTDAKKIYDMIRSAQARQSKQVG